RSFAAPGTAPAIRCQPPSHHYSPKPDVSTSLCTDLSSHHRQRGPSYGGCIVLTSPEADKASRPRSATACSGPAPVEAKNPTPTLAHHNRASAPLWRLPNHSIARGRKHRQKACLRHQRSGPSVPIELLGLEAAGRAG